VGRVARHLGKRQNSSKQLSRSQSAHRRIAVYLAATTIGAALGLAALQARAPVLLWNSTPSLPIGLYRIEETSAVKGDLIAIMPTVALRNVLNTYGLMSGDKLLLKQLKATQGDLVCRSGMIITINGTQAAVARERSGDGQHLPTWTGCRVLGATQMFALAPHPYSFDSRYFGPIEAAQVTGLPLRTEMSRCLELAAEL